MLNKLFLNLHLFDDGGEGASAGDNGGSASGENASEQISNDELARIPERARDRYKKVVSKAKAKPETQTVNVPPTEQNTNAQPTENKPEGNTHIPLSELIKSDEYKAEHQEYMDKTLGERLKKYKGIEQNFSKANETLGVIAQKYGIDASSETFLDDLSKAVNDDTTYFEDYAVAHNVSPEEAKRMIQLEQMVKRNEAEKVERERQEAMDREIQMLHASAEKTKAKFPNFDLDVEMQNEKFRNICAVTHGDTETAYKVCHFDSIVPNVVQVASQQAVQQVSNAIASGSRRPTENGLSSQASSVTTQSFKGMNKQQLEEFAKQQRLLKRRG